MISITFKDEGYQTIYNYFKAWNSSKTSKCNKVDCLSYPKCNKKVEGNYLEQTVILPKCYKDKIKIEIKVPEFLRK